MINSNVATVELAGKIEAVEFSASYSYYWLDNQSSEPVYASIGELSAEADGTYTIPAGGKLRIAGGMFPGKINLLGSGKVQIIATNTAVSPFRGGGGSSGGGKSETITPEKLGYANGAVNFFDGIYNFAHKHSDNGLFWIDIVNDFVMSRSDGSVYSDHYKKNSGINSVFKFAPITYDNFTVEVVFDIKSVSTDECDIATNYNRAGFGVHIENGTTLRISFFKNNAYVHINFGEFSTETKYNVQMVYDGNVFKAYVNGVLIGSQNVLLSEYVKSSRIFALGGLENGSYCDGAYNFYRFAVYDRALTDDEIVKNYNADKYRFNI